MTEVNADDFAGLPDLRLMFVNHVRVPLPSGLMQTCADPPSPPAHAQQVHVMCSFALPQCTLDLRVLPDARLVYVNIIPILSPWTHRPPPPPSFLPSHTPDMPRCIARHGRSWWSL